MGHANDSSTGKAAHSETLPHSLAPSDRGSAGPAGPVDSRGACLNNVMDTFRANSANARTVFDAMTGQTGPASTDALLAAAPAFLDMTSLESEKSVSEQLRELGERLKDSELAKAFEKVAVMGKLEDDQVTVSHNEAKGITIPMKDGSALYVSGKSDTVPYVKATFKESVNEAEREHKYQFTDVKGLQGSSATKDQDWRESVAAKAGTPIFGDIDNFTLTHKKHPTDKTEDIYTLHVEGYKFKGNKYLEQKKTTTRPLDSKEGKYLVLAIESLKEKGTLAQNPGKAGKDES